MGLGRQEETPTRRRQEERAVSGPLLAVQPAVLQVREVDVVVDHGGARQGGLPHLQDSFGVLVGEVDTFDETQEAHTTLVDVLRPVEVVRGEVYEHLGGGVVEGESPVTRSFSYGHYRLKDNVLDARDDGPVLQG